jgi:predicted Zn finger-like uncharacterized protein
MPEQIKCPACETKLRLPENLLGEVVKCPKCQTSFTAALDKPEPSAIVREPAFPGRRRSPARKEREEDQDDYEANEPRRRRPAAWDDAEEDDAEYDRPPRRRRIRRRDEQEARAAVAAPAICLMALGGLNIVLFLLNLLSQLLGVAMAGPNQNQSENEIIASIAVIVSLLCVQGIVIVGASRMKQLKSFGLAMTAAILAMPCGCCIAGIPIGIWCLIVINRPEVKDSFS